MPLAISKNPAISFSAQIVFHRTSSIAGSLPVTVASAYTVCTPAAPQKAANPQHRGGFAFGLFCLSLSSLSQCVLSRFHALTREAALTAGGQE